MTIEEAIKTIEIAIAEVEWEYPVEYAIAFEMAISALKKQIPKKPKVLKLQEVSGYKYGDCECGEHIMDDEKYCSNCEQAIDWRSTE